VNNFKHYITPQQAIEKGDDRPLKLLTKLSKSNGTCENCDEKAWKYVGTGLCFSCTTGEADASGDYELIEG
jgi:hypothetical protein